MLTWKDPLKKIKRNCLQTLLSNPLFFWGHAKANARCSSRSPSPRTNELSGVSIGEMRLSSSTLTTMSVLTVTPPLARVRLEDGLLLLLLIRGINGILLPCTESSCPMLCWWWWWLWWLSISFSGSPPSFSITESNRSSSGLVIFLGMFGNLDFLPHRLLPSWPEPPLLLLLLLLFSLLLECDRLHGYPPYLPSRRISTKVRRKRRITGAHVAIRIL